MLEQFADHCVQWGRQLGLTPPAHVAVATVCSGSEVLSVVLQELSASLERAGSHTTFTVPFICEFDAPKRKWCTAVLDELGHSNACTYHDLRRLPYGTSMCDRHGQCCPLPSAH